MIYKVNRYASKSLSLTKTNILTVTDSPLLSTNTFCIGIGVDETFPSPLQFSKNPLPLADEHFIDGINSSCRSSEDHTIHRMMFERGRSLARSGRRHKFVADDSSPSS
jgi:hypothetical protein